MRSRQYTREILQAEADRYCEGLRHRGFFVPASGIRIYTVGALHDLAIGAPPGFSARYSAVGGRTKDGHMTVYVKLAVSEFAPSPTLMLREQLYFQVTDPSALSGAARVPGSNVAAYDGGVAFVLERNYSYEAAIKVLRLARGAELERARLEDPWQTDPTPLTRWEQLYEWELYPQDHIPDELLERHSQRRRSNATRSRLVGEDTIELPDKENMMPKPAKKQGPAKKSAPKKVPAKRGANTPAVKAPAVKALSNGPAALTDDQKRLARNAALREWRSAHRERVREYNRAWHQARRMKAGKGGEASAIQTAGAESRG